MPRRSMRLRLIGDGHAGGGRLLQRPAQLRVAKHLRRQRAP